MKNYSVRVAFDGKSNESDFTVEIAANDKKDAILKVVDQLSFNQIKSLFSFDIVD